MKQLKKRQLQFWGLVSLVCTKFLFTSHTVLTAMIFYAFCVAMLYFIVVWVTSPVKLVKGMHIISWRRESKQLFQFCIIFTCSFLISRMSITSRESFILPIDRFLNFNLLNTSFVILYVKQLIAMSIFLFFSRRISLRNYDVPEVMLRHYLVAAGKAA